MNLSAYHKKAPSRQSENKVRILSLVNIFAVAMAFSSAVPLP